MENKLKSYIAQSLVRGHTREDITRRCLDAGWSHKLINKAFEEIENSNHEHQASRPSKKRQTLKIKIIALWFKLGSIVAFLMAILSFILAYTLIKSDSTHSTSQAIVFSLIGLLMVPMSRLYSSVSKAIRQLKRSGYLAAITALGITTAASVIFAVISYSTYHRTSDLVIGIVFAFINELLIRFLRTEKHQFSQTENKPNLAIILAINILLLLGLSAFMLYSTGKTLYVQAPQSPDFEQGKIIFSAFEGSKEEPCIRIFELDLNNSKTSLITNNAQSFVVSPDNSKLLHTDGGSCTGAYPDRKNHKTYIFDLRDRQSKEIPQVINPIKFVWSGDSRSFLYTTINGLSVFDTASNNTTPVVRQRPVLSFDWVSKNRVAFIQDLAVVNTMDLKTNEVRRITNGAEISVSPDGQTGAIVKSETSKIFLVNLNNPTSEKRLTKLPFSIQESNPVWSPDGKFVAIKIRHDYELSNIAIIDVNTRDVLYQSSDGGAEPHWSPSGSYLAFISGKQTIHLVSHSGDYHKKLITDKGTIRGIAWIIKT